MQFCHGVKSPDHACLSRFGRCPFTACLINVLSRSFYGNLTIYVVHKAPGSSRIPLSLSGIPLNPGSSITSSSTGSVPVGGPLRGNFGKKIAAYSFLCIKRCWLIHCKTKSSHIIFEIVSSHIIWDQVVFCNAVERPMMFYGRNS